MRTLAFDGRTGASGDMLLAALVAAGADPAVLSPVEDALDVEYRVGETTRNGIAAATVDVVVSETASEEAADAAVDGDDGHGRAADRDDEDDTDDGDDGDDHPHDHAHGDDHPHDHAHGDDHPHDHAHGDDHPHDHAHGDDHPHDHAHDHLAEGVGPHRSYADVLDIVAEMDLPDAVAQRARVVVRRLAEAEATVHGTSVDEIHFHEVGADDAIADIVGCCLLLDNLDVGRVVTTPVAGGGGSVEMSHGTYPIPAPAVVELASGAEWVLEGGPVESELLTPTGAALLAEFAEGVDALPSLKIHTAGYGAGTKSFDDYPNVLRAVVGDSAGGLKRDDITVLETNLDDATPEVLGGLQDSLAEVGARDVSVLPATMKKSRPGHLVKVITKPEDAERVARRLAIETGTLGIREHGAGHRWVAEREFETVTLDISGNQYDVSVKVASTVDGDVYDVSAEYDDAAAVARETGVPIREVVRRAEAVARQRID